LFGFLAKGETPLLFHCAAGKDRTGVAAAILLSLLGVHEADIYEDYLATNAAFDAIVERFLENPALAVVRDVDPDIWRPMLLADEAYLAAAFASIKTHAGGVESYARRFLGLSAGDIGEIRRILLR